MLDTDPLTYKKSQESHEGNLHDLIVYQKLRVNLVSLMVEQQKTLIEGAKAAELYYGEIIAIKVNDLISIRKDPFQRRLLYAFSSSSDADLEIIGNVQLTTHDGMQLTRVLVVHGKMYWKAPEIARPMHSKRIAAC